MRQHDEIEMKWQLRADQVEQLRRHLTHHLGPPHRLHQVNRFFDTADGHLRRVGCSLRLRRENQRLLMTCKRRVADARDGLHHYHEDEAWINPAIWFAVDRQQIDPLHCLPLPRDLRDLISHPLRLLGGFANTRFSFRDGADLLCLDRTRFSAGRVDHELELETQQPESAPAGWAQRLTRWGIDHAAQPATKLQRFLESSGDQGVQTWDHQPS